MSYYAAGGDLALYTPIKDLVFLWEAARSFGKDFGSGAFPVQREKMTMSEARARFASEDDATRRQRELAAIAEAMAQNVSPTRLPKHRRRRRTQRRRR